MHASTSDIDEIYEGKIFRSYGSNKKNRRENGRYGPNNLGQQSGRFAAGPRRNVKTRGKPSTMVYARRACRDQIYVYAGTGRYSTETNIPRKFPKTISLSAHNSSKTIETKCTEDDTTVFGRKGWAINTCTEPVGTVARSKLEISPNSPPKKMHGNIVPRKFPKICPLNR